MNLDAARTIMRGAADNVQGFFTTHRPFGDSKFYLAVEVLDLWKVGPVIEHCALRGLHGSKVSDTGLASYVYWEDFTCGSI